MKSVLYRVRHGALAVTATLAGVAATLVGCAAPRAEPPVKAAWTPPPPGTTIVRTRTNTGSWGNGTSEIVDRAERRTWNGTEVYTFTNAGGASVYTMDGRLWALLDPNGKPAIRFESPSGSYGVRFPLAVGNTWNESSNMTLADGPVLPHDNACRVASYEPVTVPAGTFPAYRIDCSSSRGLEQTFWYSTVDEAGHALFVKSRQVRSASNPFGGAGTRDEELVAIRRP